MATFADARTAKDAVRELLEGRPEVHGVGLDSRSSDAGVDFGVRVDLHAEPSEPILEEWCGVRVVVRHVTPPASLLPG